MKRILLSGDLLLALMALINQWRARLRAEQKVEHQQEEEEGAAVIHLIPRDAGIGPGATSNRTYVYAHCQQRAEIDQATASEV